MQRLVFVFAFIEWVWGLLWWTGCSLRWEGAWWSWAWRCPLSRGKTPGLLSMQHLIPKVTVAQVHYVVLLRPDHQLLRVSCGLRTAAMSGKWCGLSVTSYRISDPLISSTPNTRTLRQSSAVLSYCRHYCFCVPNSVACEYSYSAGLAWLRCPNWVASCDVACSFPQMTAIDVARGFQSQSVR